MNKADTKVPSNLILVSVLSGGITIVVSIIYIVLSSIALAYRYDCDAADLSSLMANQLFWATTYKVYIQIHKPTELLFLHCECLEPLSSEECVHLSLDVQWGSLTQPHTVFVLLCLTLSFSVVTLITACILIAMITKNNVQQYIDVYVYTYIGSWVGSLVVDVTFATHVGMDYTYITNELMGVTVFYELDMIRQGAFYLMTIALKGYAIHAISLVLIFCMVVYLFDYREITKQNEHPIHKVGAINAFDQPRRIEDSWSQPDMYFGRGMNNGFPEDPRNTNRNDYYNNSRSQGSFRRSESWKQQAAPQPPALASTSGARPFSYLEEVRRPAPVKPPVSPAAEHWRGAWPPPPVPAPDYSPHSPRRLKSALKPSYM